MQSLEQEIENNKTLLPLYISIPSKMFIGKQKTNQRKSRKKLSESDENLHIKLVHQHDDPRPSSATRLYICPYLVCLVYQGKESTQYQGAKKVFHYALPAI